MHCSLLADVVHNGVSAIAFYSELSFQILIESIPTYREAANLSSCSSSKGILTLSGT